MSNDELARAMREAAQAYEQDPSEAHRARIDELARKAPDPFVLAPLQPGRAALPLTIARIRLLFTANRAEEALALFRWLVEVAPRDALFIVLEQSLDAEALASVAPSCLYATVASILEYVTELPVPVRAAADLRRVAAAAEIVTRVREHFPNAAQLYASELIVRRRLPDTRRSIELAERAVQRFPNDASCGAALVHAFADAGRPVEALDAARRAFSQCPEDGSPLYDAARAFASAGYPSEAARLFSELLERFPDYPEAREELAHAREKVSSH